MAHRLEPPTPYQYVYNVEHGIVTEFVLVRENDKSFCVLPNNSYSKVNRNVKKEYLGWPQNRWERTVNPLFGATVRNYEQAMILCNMVFDRAKFRKTIHRGKDGSAGGKN